MSIQNNSYIKVKERKAKQAKLKKSGEEEELEFAEAIRPFGVLKSVLESSGGVQYYRIFSCPLVTLL